MRPPAGLRTAGRHPAGLHRLAVLAGLLAVRTGLLAVRTGLLAVRTGLILLSCLVRVRLAVLARLPRLAVATLAGLLAVLARLPRLAVASLAGLLAVLARLTRLAVATLAGLLAVLARLALTVRVLLAVLAAVGLVGVERVAHENSIVDDVTGARWATGLLGWASVGGRVEAQERLGTTAGRVSTGAPSR